MESFEAVSTSQHMGLTGLRACDSPPFGSKEYNILLA